MKESQYSGDRRLIFREVFDSEQGVRSRGGVPTGVTFENGMGVFDGTSSTLSISKRHYGTFSFRIKIKNYQKTGAWGILFNYDSIIARIQDDLVFEVTTGTKYVNGVTASSVTLGSDLDIIATGLPGNTTMLTIGSYYSGLYLHADIELFEIYSGTLSATEVANLYANKTYKAPVLDHAEQLGPELIDQENWYKASYWGGGASWSSITGILTSTVDSITIMHNAILTVGKLYKITYNISSIDATIASQDNGSWIGSDTTIGMKTYYHKAVDIQFGFTPSGNKLSTITSLSIKEVLVNETKTILSVDSFDGVIQNRCSGQTINGNLVPSVVNTAVTVEKQGDINAMRFNGTTSKISSGSYDTLVSDISISSWINPKSLGEGSAGMLINNGQFNVGINATNNRISVTSNNSTVIYSGTNTLRNNLHLGISRTSAGVTNIYINGILSGTANQASGTPVAGGDITIGNNTGASATWDGLIPGVKIVSGIMTAEEFAQEYSANKSRYGL